MKRLFSYLMTIPFMVGFGGILTVVHPFFLVARCFGKGNEVMLALNYLLNRNLFLFAGVRFKCDFEDNLPYDRPLIIVSNHQSMFDVTLFYEVFGVHHIKFVAKVELRRWIPSVSWALRNLGSVLIRREDARQSITAIKNFGRRVEREKFSVLLFPEGTRARDGALKKFQSPGLLSLLRESPSALIVPAVIDGSWEIVRYKFWPVPYGVRVTLKVLEAIEPRDYDLKELTGVVEQRVAEALQEIRGASTVTTPNEPDTNGEVSAAL